MKNLVCKLWFFFAALWRIHIGISSAVSLVVVAIVVYQWFLKNLLAVFLQSLSTSYDPNSLSHAILTGVGSSIVSAVIFTLFGGFVLNWHAKIRLTGDYKAFTVEDNEQETNWGTVTIKYHPLSINTHHTPVKLYLKFQDIVLEGDGLMVDNRYLLGYYCETGKTERRRAGSFMYELDGTGTVWSGNYTCIHPESSTPQVHKAVWRRA